MSKQRIREHIEALETDFQEFSESRLIQRVTELEQHITKIALQQIECTERLEDRIEALETAQSTRVSPTFRRFKLCWYRNGDGSQPCISEAVLFSDGKVCVGGDSPQSGRKIGNVYTNLEAMHADFASRYGEAVVEFID